VVLQRGQAVEAGPVAELFAAPQHPYTQSLVAAARRFDAALEAAP
jgi:peptide/nickel transport system ATP-binding protein